MAKRRKPSYSIDELFECMHGYISCFLFFQTLPSPVAEDGEEWDEGQSYEEGGFGSEDLTPSATVALERTCREFLDRAATSVRNGYEGDGDPFDMAGHDLALRQFEFGDGFGLDRGWSRRASKTLSRIADESAGPSFEPVNGAVSAPYGRWCDRGAAAQYLAPARTIH